MPNWSLVSTSQLTDPTKYNQTDPEVRREIIKRKIGLLTITEDIKEVLRLILEV